MKSRLVWMVATGLALAAIFLIFVQASSLLALAPDDTDVVSESDSEVQNDPKAEPVENSLQPVYVRTISEYGSGTNRKLRLGGTSQPNAVLTLLNQNERMRQLKVDENGLWQAELDFDSNASLVLEVIMFVEDGPSVRGDETIYRLPVPTSPDSDSGAALFSRPALIMVSAPGGPTRIVQSPFGGSPTSGPLTMRPIDYDDSGGVIFSGTTEDEGRVRIYAGGAVVGETRVDAGGRWNFIAGNLLPRGEYSVAAELIRANDERVRVTVPFALLPPVEDSAVTDTGFPTVIFEPFRWQVRRRLLGGGAQTTVIFAPDDSGGIIVQAP